MNVICINDDAFNALLKEIIKKIREEHESSVAPKWITTEAAMARLGISSKTTLQKLRDHGEIEFSHPSKKIILYNVESLEAYLERHTRKAF